MKIKGSLIAAIFFLALGLFGIIQSLTFHFWESMALPLALSVVITIAASIEVVRELHRRSNRAATTETSGKDNNNDGKTRRLWTVLGWVAGLITAIYLLGFYIAVPIFCLSYLKVNGRSWLATIIFTVVMVAFLYGIFELGLKAQLYRGFLFGAR
jgi:hypothetical protein